MKPPIPRPLLSQKKHSKTHNFLPNPSQIFFTIFVLIQIPKTTSIDPPEIPLEYIKHCNDVVPASRLDLTASDSGPANFRDIDFDIGYFTGGESLFFQSNAAAADEAKSASLTVRISSTTVDSNEARIYKVVGKLALRIPRSASRYSSGGGFLNPRLGLSRNFQIIPPKIPVAGRRIPVFSLGGFWSESTGRLCMIGSGISNGDAGKFRTLNAVLKLNYSTNFNVTGSLISGVLQSSDSEHNSSYFEPISILGIRKFDTYEFSLVDNGKGSSCLSEEENLDIGKVKGGLCSVIARRKIRFEMDYGMDCDEVNCSSIIKDSKYVPNSMLFRQRNCVDKGKMQILFAFSKSSTVRTYFPFNPNSTLIGEGAWDEKNHSVCGVACRVLNFGDSLNQASIGDCSIKFSFRYPKVLTLRNRDSIVGKIWSDKSKDDPSYFDTIGFRSVWEVNPGLKNVPGLRYEYTEVDNARKFYASKHVAEHNGKTYPKGDSIDMRFDMLVIDSNGESAWGIANPMFVGDQPYRYPFHGFVPLSIQSAAVHSSNNNSRLLNMSYEISYSYYSSNGSVLDKGSEISAEGIYDRHSGILFMVGCKKLRYENHSSTKKDSLDCDILVTIQFSPINAAEKYRVKGTIESTRIKSDPLYFRPISLSSKSFYAGQAKESIWRMDLEITMVLVSNTLACLFVGLQLFHVKKHPEVLSFVSVLMLIVLTLGHMIPLLLNFEALFVPNRNQQQNAFLESGGWLEVNEIIVRAVTMVAFLLQFRLLQLTWSERQGNETRTSLWGAEKKALYISLPLYVSGGLIAWFVHQWKNSRRTPFLRPRQRRFRMKYRQTSSWTDFKSYGGLVLDGFLLPQIVFNIFSQSNENALSASFYIGTTLVRLLPHAYDLYRAHISSGNLDLSFIYANHKMDFYSTAWDIIIPCGGLLFAIFIFLQQRFGGQCLIPKRFRKEAVYEKVSVENSEELQGESVQKNFYSL